MPRKRRDLRVSLSAHDRMLLVLYRTLTEEARRAVDRALSREWTGHGGRPKLPAEEENARLTRAIRHTKADYMPSSLLVYLSERPW